MLVVKLEVWTGGSNLVKYVYLSTSMPGAGMWELRLAGAGFTTVATELYLITSSLPVPQSTSTCSRSP